MFSTREMSRMSLPFGDIFMIDVLVWGLVLWFEYFSWKILPHFLHFKCYLLLGYLSFL